MTLRRALPAVLLLGLALSAATAAPASACASSDEACLSRNEVCPGGGHDRCWQACSSAATAAARVVDSEQDCLWVPAPDAVRN